MGISNLFQSRIFRITSLTPRISNKNNLHHVCREARTPRLAPGHYASTPDLNVQRHERRCCSSHRPQEYFRTPRRASASMETRSRLSRGLRRGYREDPEGARQGIRESVKDNFGSTEGRSSL